MGCTVITLYRSFVLALINKCTGNIGNIKDKAFVDKTAKEVETIIADGNKLKAEILEIVDARIKELAESK